MPREFKINPKYMCDVHLKGEHYELHVFVGLLKLRRQVSEYVKGNMLEISTLKERHDELVRELQTRFKNFNHDSPLEVPDVSYLPKEIINHKIVYADLYCIACTLCIYYSKQNNQTIN